MFQKANSEYQIVGNLRSQSEWCFRQIFYGNLQYQNNTLTDFGLNSIRLFGIFNTFLYIHTLFQ